MTDSISFHAWLYDHLAQVFDGSIARRPPLPPAAPREGPIREAIDALADALESVEPDQTQADHARLFLNAPEGVAAPPYASWYLDGCLLGPSASWVAAAYRQQQVEIAPEGGEPPDYLACELEFILGAERRFIEGHLACWIPQFLARVRAGRPGAVFAAAADLLTQLLAIEQHRVARR
jgi:TorA maturation chaperone TorD